MNPETENPEQAFICCTSYFITNCPNMLTFYNLFKKKENYAIETLRINVVDDSFPLLEYNPAWVSEIYSSNKYFFICLVYMEMLKFILHHTTTRAGMGDTAKASLVIVNDAESRRALNIMDFHERNKLLDFLDSVPSRTWLEKTLGGKIPNEHYFLEKIEEYIRENPTKCSITVKQNQGENDGSHEGESDNSGDEPGQGNNTSGNGQDNESKQSGEGQGDSTEDNGSGDKDTEKGPGAGQGDRPEEKAFTEKALKENSEKWGESSLIDELVTQTFENSSTSGWGSSISPDTFLRIKAANQRKVNVKVILSRIRQSIFSEQTYSSRMRPNRRHGMRIPGHRHEYKAKILLAVDFSGSMHPDWISKAVSTFNSYIKDAKVDYCFWDTRCSEPVPLGKNGITATGDVVSTVCGGGTNPSCIGDFLDEHRHNDYDCVILFTDCVWVWDKKNINGKVVVIDVKEGSMCSGYRLPDFVDFKIKLKDLIGQG